ncbi:P-loop containing nucleoside triphosphate hydrolase protein [Fimicolochytrium jonesii]|uniref:P-loop containing nucleoside triphosphate hydrolase protein n=1 Tax=Fimicolochytrium jonesii TaxID=1396493 RepID=UPI0022FEC1EE|nr:P-loop containing nucleoside triphosphate hydrolase protein [Fimicolochytrium jonesii]KAI8826161.1 P-loop containing nucleoside triphosphate hydrolase protein [Fimicolochytrium jonesii]
MVLGFGNIEGAGLEARKLSVFQSNWRGKEKQAETKSILRNVTLSVPQGNIMAIMGGSGSGKTTLLNALCGRLNTGQVSGEVTMDSVPARTYIASGRVAYVQQSDQLLPYLTVRETLRYAARLRLPRDMPKAEKFELVENVIAELGLKECADTIIGNDRRKGCSGGEKRRVSVGVQLLLNPSMIFLDEPTTGLDAFTSLSLIQTLVELARKGRTICVSIHQPRSDIFELFDNIVLLSRGDLVYSGPRSSVLSYFESLSYNVPEHMNPADYLIDVSSVDNRDTEAEEKSKAKLKTLVDAWVFRSHTAIEDRVGPVGGIEMAQLDGDGRALLAADRKQPSTCGFEHGAAQKIGASPVQQTIVIAERTFKNLLQDRLTFWGSVLEVLLLAGAVGLIFLRLDETQSGILGRKSALYITASVQNYLGLMFMIYKLSQEMQVFDRERKDKMYSVVPYLVGWLIANFLLYAALAVLFSCIIYFMIGLRTDSSFHFGVFVGANVLMQFVTIGWAYFCISWARGFATASLIGNSFFTFLSTSSGFFIQVDQIPIYLRWFKWISYITYGFRLLSTNEFSDKSYACPDVSPTNGRDDPRCQGNVILQTLGFGTDDYSFPIVALVINYFVLMILTGLILHLKPYGGITHAASVKTKTEKKISNLDVEGQTPASESSVPRINITLDNVSLYLTKKSPLSKASSTSITILDGVSASFQAGHLSIILGASGAGKSSLLNILMARGLPTGAFLKTTQTGRILYKGMEIMQPAQVASLCSLVVQDDHHLLPGLTARETLRYSALLRLPKEMSKPEKLMRADKVLLELGLKDCADRLVGGEGIAKGLSGGEKRRLSIGVQMLTNPAVLIIDEPTSGLDSFTSHNLILKLKEIATSGRTIICSIHQPRSDIVKEFDSVLLLASGGRTVYSGAAKDMLPYFASLNHPAPRLTNPADFALDLSSIDLRNPTAEEASRARLTQLVASWRTMLQPRSPSDEPLNYKPPAPPRTRSAHEGGPESSENAQGSTVDIASLAYRSPAVFATALSVLVRRSMRNMMRQVNLASARIMQVVALAVIFALYFAGLGKNQASVQSRFGILQQQGSLIFVGMLNCIAVFPQELSLMRFEYRDNVYSVASFFVSYCVNEFPFELVSALLYAIIIMFAVGLQASVSNFFTLAYIAFCFINTGESLGIAFCALVDSIGFSVQAMSTVLSLEVMMAGFLSVKMPKILEGLNYLFITRFVARIVAVQEFTGLHFDCSPAETASGTCVFQTGDDALRLLDFDTSHSQWVLNMVMVAVLTVVFRVVAYGVLWARTKN